VSLRFNPVESMSMASYRSAIVSTMLYVAEYLENRWCVEDVGDVVEEAVEDDDCGDLVRSGEEEQGQGRGGCDATASNPGLPNRPGVQYSLGVLRVSV
jgi:hypothetical protein